MLHCMARCTAFHVALHGMLHCMACCTAFHVALHGMLHWLARDILQAAVVAVPGVSDADIHLEMSSHIERTKAIETRSALGRA